ncbi:glutathione S-transferase omega-1-like [Clavelina lepadiformis]|uniref:glutathione S-transferase omega-1-like n=1 Tax=Clavelina lepadiformis TaxID=159417 RepID=UPI004041FF34
MAGMGNAKHLKAGDAEPAPPAKDVLRVYGMEFCPYVERLKLVLAAKDIKHETVNINIQKKPDWFFQKNPRGTVPVIEKNGEILYESDITSEYVDEAYPGRRLRTSDPLQRAKEKIVLGDFMEVVSNYYALVKETDEGKRSFLTAAIKANLGKVENFLGNTPYFCGQRPGFTDYMIWPKLERILLFDPEFIKQNPKIESYCDRIGDDKAVKACRHPNQLLLQYFEGFKAGNPVYDIGTVE